MLPASTSFAVLDLLAAGARRGRATLLVRAHGRIFKCSAPLYFICSESMAHADLLLHIMNQVLPSRCATVHMRMQALLCKGSLWSPLSAHRPSRTGGAVRAQVRKNGTVPWVRPDGKTQVTCEYRKEGGAMIPVRVHTILISTQHSPDVTNDQIHADLMEHVIKPVVPAKYLDDKTIFHLNPSGAAPRALLPHNGGPHDSRSSF